MSKENTTPSVDWGSVCTGLAQGTVPSMSLPTAFFWEEYPKFSTTSTAKEAFTTVFGLIERYWTVRDEKKKATDPHKQVAAETNQLLDKVTVARIAESLLYSGNKTAITRLYLGDLVWLYFHERMGVFQILNRLVDDYTRSGRLTIRCTESLGLERLARRIQSGEGSSARERAATYARSLGWKSDNLPDAGAAQPNLTFDPAWRNFLRLALTYYRGRNVSSILASGGTQSTASVVSACDAAKNLWQAFAPFENASNYAATFHGLAWLVVTLHEIETIMPKVAPGLDAASEGSGICAAYEMLVLGKNASGQDASRYVVHDDCARYARKILLDLQGIKATSGNEVLLTSWIQDTSTETNVEGYRSAWQRLTGEDLGPVTNVRMTSG